MIISKDRAVGRRGPGGGLGLRPQEARLRQCPEVSAASVPPGPISTQGHSPPALPVSLLTPYLNRKSLTDTFIFLGFVFSLH